MARSVILLLTVLLALATGLGLLWTASALRSPAVSVAPATGASDESVTTAVRRFYAAANGVLKTGEIGQLTDAVAPGVASHDRGAIAAGIGDYAQQLVRLRATCPDCTLALGRMSIDDDLVTALVTIDGGQRTTALGLRMDGPVPPSVGYETVRIDGGRVAELWRQGDSLDLPQTVLENVPISLPAGPSVLQVAQLTLRSGTELAAMAGPGPQVILVEAGALTIRSDGGLNGEDQAERGDVIGPGEWLATGMGLRHAVRNEGEVPAEVLVVAIYPFAEPNNGGLTPVDVWRGAAGVGVSGRLMASSIINEPEGGRATVAAERVTLVPGTGIAAHRARAAEVVFVESGSLAVSASAHTTWLTRAPDFGTGSQVVVGPEGLPHNGGETMLASGDAAVIHRGNVQAIRSAGDESADVLLIRIVSVQPT